MKGAEAGVKSHGIGSVVQVLSGALASPVKLTSRDLRKFIFRDASCPL
jgi:hypothetical protein